jgi:hypothetical protein
LRHTTRFEGRRHGDGSATAYDEYQCGECHSREEGIERTVTPGAFAYQLTLAVMKDD